MSNVSSVPNTEPDTQYIRVINHPSSPGTVSVLHLGKPLGLGRMETVDHPMLHSP